MADADDEEDLWFMLTSNVFELGCSGSNVFWFKIYKSLWYKI